MVPGARRPSPLVLKQRLYSQAPSWESLRVVIALDSVTYFFQEKNVFSLRFPSSSAFVVFRGLATSPEEHLLGDTNKPVQVFLVKWIPPAHPTPQACPSGSGGGGAGGRFWILIQFLLRAITVSLQATQAAGYVCTENSAVGGETKGKETGGGGGLCPEVTWCLRQAARQYSFRIWPS